MDLFRTCWLLQDRMYYTKFGKCMDLPIFCYLTLFKSILGFPLIQIFRTYTSKELSSFIVSSADLFPHLHDIYRNCWLWRTDELVINVMYTLCGVPHTTFLSVCVSKIYRIDTLTRDFEHKRVIRTNSHIQTNTSHYNIHFISI